MIKIEPIPAYADNYIWCLYDDSSAQAVIVDPGDAKPVLDYLKANNLALAAIIITHHHFDHIGGVEELLSHNQVSVYGPDNNTIASITHTLTEGARINLLGLDFEVLCIPGHTLDHIAYYCENGSEGPLVFCGDTLFAGGCGRVFEGDPAMMYSSLNKLAALPLDTRIYCAHEYTLGNLAFAKAVEPANTELLQRIVTDTSKRSESLPTVPSLLSLEKATNPFLRCDVDSVIGAAQAFKGKIYHDPVEVFATIRSWKDNF